MQLEWSNETTLFTLIKHRINNTGWTMKWWWREGWNEVQTPVLRECWTFLIYIFLHQKRKQCLEFALPIPGEICKHLAGAYNSNSHARGLHYLTYVCGKQSRENQCNGASRFKEKCLRKAQHYQSSLKEEKALCSLNSLTLPPNNHNHFCEIYRKRGAGVKRNLWPLAYNAKV